LIPAVVHVDGTARPQTVSENENLLFYKIVKAFFYETGVPLLVNTSFNMHEEPINGGYLDSIKALQVGAIDLIVHEKGIFLRK
jgi:carbamoyltransferase